MGGIETNYGSFSVPRYNRVMLDIDSIVESEEDEEESESKEATDQYQSRPRNTGKAEVS